MTAVTESEVLVRVRRAVSDVLNVPEEKITLDADFKEDFQAESLDIISLISELEEQFDQDITDDDAMSLKTVGDAVRFIEASLAKEA
jgi:acyl carrier protein